MSKRHPRNRVEDAVIGKLDTKRAKGGWKIAPEILASRAEKYRVCIEEKRKQIAKDPLILAYEARRRSDRAFDRELARAIASIISPIVPLVRVIPAGRSPIDPYIVLCASNARETFQRERTLRRAA